MDYQHQSSQSYASDRPRQHGRTRSAFSLNSNKSGKSDHSAGSKPKVDNLVETEAEKRKRKFKTGTRANPNTAMQEAQPMVQAQEASTLASLRSLQLKDMNGNDIVDPDSSNPSRPRMERPLDTIRSFQAAIDSSYKKRDQVQRTESADAARDNSRRSSMYGNGNEYPPNARQSPGAHGYNDARFTRQSSYDQYHGQQQQQQQHAQPGYMQRQRPRGPAYSHQQPGPEYGVYPNHTYHDSNDTFQTAYSSGSQSEQWANSTDPTSDSGSMDRTQGYKNGDFSDAYGDHWKGSPIDSAIMEEHGNNTSQGYYPPATGVSQRQQRNPIKLGNSPPVPPHQQQQQAYGTQYYSDQHQKPLPNMQQNNYQLQQKPLPNIQQNNYQSQENYYRSNQNGQNGSNGVNPSSKQPSRGPPPVSAGRLQKSPSDDKRKSWLKRRFSKD